MSDLSWDEKLGRYTSQWLDVDADADADVDAGDVADDRADGRADDRADDRASDRADDYDRGRPSCQEPSGNAAPPWDALSGGLDGAAEAQVADLQLVDALLASQSEQAAVEREVRIGRVLGALQTPTRATLSTTRSPLRRWRTGLAVAAAVLISFGLLWLQLSKESRASALLREVGRVSLEPQDRVYVMRVSDPRTSGQPHREGHLYLRGCEGLVVVCDDVILGCNAEECWFVPSKGSVVVAEDFDWIVGSSVEDQRQLELLREISVESRRAPLVQLSAVAELMQHDYDVALESVSPPDGDSAEVLVGRLRPRGDSDLPNTIRLWCRADSRIIHRAEFSWGSEASALNRLVLELTDRGAVPADWYGRERHHSLERPVRRVSSDK